MLFRSDQSIIRDIGIPEMVQAILENAVIIEDYPDDKDDKIRK